MNKQLTITQINTRQQPLWDQIIELEEAFSESLKIPIQERNEETISILNKLFFDTINSKNKPSVNKLTSRKEY